jgi:hypothetical protein
LDLVSEEASDRGRLDLRLRCSGDLRLFELKVVEWARHGGALEQIKVRGSAKK